jgi:predicted neutral ceramidase superfamily lipid hydrolase
MLKLALNYLSLATVYILGQAPRILKLAPLFAFLGYGGWALWVNYYAGAENYFKSSIVQGSYAFISTLLTRLVVLKIQKTTHNKLLTFVYCFGLMALIPSSIHYFIHTKEILYSILPGLIIGSFYIVLILKFEANYLSSS